jgi:adenylyltransferase/sulfurtransferase
LEIDVEELDRRLRDGETLAVLDVREPWELEVARLPATLDIPMNELPERIGELPRDKPLAVLCRSGARSLRVTQYLRQLGFEQASNVAGGILAWADRIDPGVSKY